MEKLKEEESLLFSPSCAAFFNSSIYSSPPPWLILFLLTDEHLFLEANDLTLSLAIAITYIHIDESSQSLVHTARLNPAQGLYYGY